MPSSTFLLEHLSLCDPSLLSAEFILSAYSNSFFPMAEGVDLIRWHSPDPRAIFPLEELTVSRSLRKALERSSFDMRINTSFYDVIVACSRRDVNDDVWISDDIVRIYCELHELGVAHSIETWLDNELVGGLYGLSIGAAFFGESMFSRVSNASKAAFVHLAAHLKMMDYRLLDTQYINHFTEQLGAIEISRSEYLALLEQAISLPHSFYHGTVE